MTGTEPGARRRIAAGGERHYATLLAEHGPGPLGVGWNSERAQHARFEQLARVFGADEDAFSVLDYGCGTGALLPWLRARGHTGPYTGFDLSEAMLAGAREAHGGDAAARFTSDPEEPGAADFVLASGVLNLRFDLAEEEWRDYTVGIVDHIASIAKRGFAVNMLSSHSDPERMRPELLYADPAWWLEHCLERYSTRVALLHDYEVWDFTLVVRLDPRPTPGG
ncbi:MAG: methyltransferase domain-containing protein [Thermoleophilaceae bacterium]|nr:methyltransferase domain-containing protein [Thermoleophilaceae bacterium]